MRDPTHSALAALVVFRLVCFWAPSAAAEEATPGYPERVVQWTVQAGETCDDVAAALYGAAEHRGLVQRYNAVDCRPGAALAPGRTLVLPEAPASLPPARLASFAPYTQARPPGGEWAPATRGLPLYRDYSVNTLGGARAELVFRDATVMVLGEHTLVVIYDTARESLGARTTSVALELDAGEVQAGLAALSGDAAARLRVAGGGEVAAASRDTVVRTRAPRSTVSVFDGSASVTSGGREVLVPDRHGTSFVRAAAPTPPRLLPVAPNFAPSSTRGVVLATAGEGVVTAAWDEVPRAVTYRVELARDPGFRELVLRREVSGSIRALRAENLPSGAYYVRVRAIDDEDYLGLASAPLEILLVGARFVGGGGRLGGAAIVAGRYAALALDTTAGIELAYDGLPFTPATEQLELASRDAATLRLRRAGDAHANTYTLTTIEPRLHFSVRREGGGGQTRVTVAFEALAGAALAEVVRPRLRVHAGHRVQELELELAGDTGSALVSTGAARKARLDVVDASGRLLGSATLELATGAPAALEAGNAMATAVAAAPPVPTDPATSVVWWAPVAPSLVAASAVGTLGEVGGGGQVHGRTSAQLGGVGLDARVASNALGDLARADEQLWLGARWRALAARADKVHLGPALRAGLPLTDASPPPRLDVGAAVRLRAGAVAWLVNGGARARLGSAPERAAVPAASGYLLGGATWAPSPWWLAYAVTDLHLLGDGGVAGRAGLAVGAEGGGALFGGLALRVAPWDDPGARTTLQASLGVRR